MGEKNKEKAKENLTSEEQEEISKILIAAEKELPSNLRKVQGDSREAALIRFVQPIMDIDKTR